MKYLTFILLSLLILPISLSAQESTKNSAFFSVNELEKELESSGKPWLYFLKAGANDPQQPHDTDEIYYVLSGSSLFEVGEEKRRIKSGDILFVKAEIKHRFYDIEEDLKLLVFFDQ